jgi:hypothetical protein
MQIEKKYQFFLAKMVPGNEVLPNFETTGV